MRLARRRSGVGDRATRWCYVALIAGAFVAAVIAAVGGRPWSVLAVGAAVAALAPVRVVLGGAAGPALIPVLGATGRTQMLYGLLFSIGLALG